MKKTLNFHLFLISDYKNFVLKIVFNYKLISLEAIGERIIYNECKTQIYFTYLATTLRIT
jgi:hypothetical protein